MWLTWLCTLATLIFSISNAGMSSLTWSMLATFVIVTVALYHDRRNEGGHGESHLFKHGVVTEFVMALLREMGQVWGR